MGIHFKWVPLSLSLSLSHTRSHHLIWDSLAFLHQLNHEMENNEKNELIVRQIIIERTERTNKRRKKKQYWNFRVECAALRSIQIEFILKFQLAKMKRRKKKILDSISKSMTVSDRRGSSHSEHHCRNDPFPSPIHELRSGRESLVACCAPPPFPWRQNRVVTRWK